MKVTKKTEQQNPENDLEAPDSAELEVEVMQDDADQLRTELTQALEEAKIHQEQYLRTLADMENLRKRTQRDKEQLVKFANEGILREILSVIDNLERAVEHAEQADNDDGLLEGVQMTLTQFGQVLNRCGVEPVEAVGQPFDPAFHQAMGQLESEEYPVNTVIQQAQKGYQLNNRLLRPAFVMLAKAPIIEATEETTVEEIDKEETDKG
ncbi:MAG: nucleotide exchange factor GrpE [Desulfuromusa sp.]|nr:nucleotide exchange factor GrpE [Desulfuromusa sp.]